MGSRGVWTLASGLMTTENNYNKSTENLVNLDTNAYKSSQLKIGKFDDYILYKKAGNGMVQVGENLFDGIYSNSAHTDFSFGEFDTTDRKLDFAINGIGFFQLEDGTLTRAGSFHSDDEGYLTHISGKRILGAENNPILLNTEKIELNASGNLIDENGKVLGQIRIVLVDEEMLQRTSDNCFTVQNSQNVQILELPHNDTELKQGILEGSNVKRINEICNTVEYSKLHAIYTKGLKMYDDLDEKLNSING